MNHRKDQPIPNLWKLMGRGRGGHRISLAALTLAALLVLAATGVIQAQSQAINGTIRGRVLDPSGAGVPASAVTAVNDATGYTRSASSSDEGYYVIPNLPLGTYTVTVQSFGFSSVRNTNVVLTAGTEAVIDINLKLGPVATEVEVTAGAPIVDPARINIGRTINTQEVENLPLTSRNPYNFILFQPGVSGHPNPEFGVPRTINTNGLLDRINYQLDGMNNTESDRYGLRLIPISNVYVREVQTVGSSFSPEFGGTSGIIYNVITNSGTNQFHGFGRYLFRRTDLTARPILLPGNRAKPTINVDNISGNVGGPIRKDKLFFFGAYEYVKRDLPTPNVIDSTKAAQLGIPSDLLRNGPRSQRVHFLNGRADWNITPRHSMFLRYNYFRNQSPFNNGIGGLNALDAASDFRDRSHVYGFQLVSTFSTHLLNELRGGWAYRNERNVPNALAGPGPQISVTGVATFNGTSDAGFTFVEKVPNITDAITWIHGAHTLKGGFGLQIYQDVRTNDVFSRFNFPSIQAFLDSKSGKNPFAYSTLTTSIGDTRARYTSVFWDFFVQDSWQVRPDLLLTYGIRYDRFQSPDADPNAPFPFSRRFQDPSGNVSPRVGLAWRVNPKTVVRTHFGVFYDAPPTNLWFNALSNDGSNRSFVASISSSSPLAPAFPNTVASLPANFRIPDVTTVTPDFKNAHTLNASLQVTRELTPNDALTLGYVFTGGHQLLFLRNINLINPIGTLADGRPVFSSSINASTRLFPQFNNVQLQDVGTNSNYNALVVNFQHRQSRGFLIDASYTYSKSITDAPDVNAFEQNLPLEDPTNRLRDRGNSTVNRPHALTVSTVLEPNVKSTSRFWNQLLNHNQVAILLNTSSGDQQNVRANKVLNGDATTSAVTRPLFVGRNTVRGPNIFQLDLRYTRSFPIHERYQAQFIAEFNNITNHPNVTSLNTVLPVDKNGAAVLPVKFPSLSTVLEARIIQFGFGVRF